MRGQVVLLGVVGSTAYGLATPESDQDFLGVYQAPTEAWLGLHPPQESIVTHKPNDKTVHELSKFVKLCLQNNPTVMELLWLDEYQIRTNVGEELISIRKAFLSTKVKRTYGGYATQQLERLKRREDGSFSSDLRKRTEKHGRHCYRLILQGSHVLKEGELRVRLTEDEVQQCREAGLCAANDVEEFSKMIDVAMAEFDAIQSDLPECPDEYVVEEFLVKARLSNLERI
jgi:hypothetical protein